jgi:hypothetical protein
VLQIQTQCCNTDTVLQIQTQYCNTENSTANTGTVLLIQSTAIQTIVLQIQTQYCYYRHSSTIQTQYCKYRHSTAIQKTVLLIQTQCCNTGTVLQNRHSAAIQTTVLQYTVLQYRRSAKIQCAYIFIHIIPSFVKGKVKHENVHGRQRTAPLILNLGTKWRLRSQLHATAVPFPEKEPQVPTKSEAG